MRVGGYSILISAGLFLAACGAIDRHDKTQAVNGTVLGKAAWKPIPAAVSRVKMLEAEPFVVSREANHLPDRYMERWRVQPTGTLIFEELHTRYFGYDSDPRTNIMQQSKQIVSRFGAVFAANQVREVDFQNSKLYFLTLRSPDRDCFLYDSFFGDTSAGNGNRRAAGTICQEAGTGVLPLENMMLVRLRMLDFTPPPARNADLAKNDRFLSGGGRQPNPAPAGNQRPNRR